MNDPYGTIMFGWDDGGDPVIVRCPDVDRLSDGAWISPLDLSALLGDEGG